jgi:thiol-disulfide isomerase/thioredoxin
MKFARSAVVAMVLVAGTMFTGSALATPTDAEVDAAIATFKTKMQAAAGNAPARKAASAAALEKLPIAELTYAQLARLSTEGILRTAMDKRTEVHDRLLRLAEEKTVEGAASAILAAEFLPYPATPTRELMEKMNKDRNEAIFEATKHPAFADALKTDVGVQFLQTVATMDGEEVAGRPIWNLVEQAIPGTATPKELSKISGVINTAADPEAHVAPEQLEAIRTKLVALTESTKAAAMVTDVADADAEKAAKKVEARDRVVKSIEGRLDLLNGAFAKGELLGHKSPAFTFEWSSGDTKLSTLEDLKGKVVVLDFWATWCGPCVGSFPQVRDLTAHYAGYPVVVLGVTSVQGFHYKRSLEEGFKPEQVDTKGEPEKEMALMKDFMKDMNMTWTVAFSKQNVFNPEFGVNGIPHVAIIDPNGVVRYRGLHPASDPVKKHEMIDGLLKEFKLPTPPAEAAKPAETKGN